MNETTKPSKKLKQEPPDEKQTKATFIKPSYGVEAIRAPFEPSQFIKKPVDDTVLAKKSKESGRVKPKSSANQLPPLGWHISDEEKEELLREHYSEMQRLSTAEKEPDVDKAPTKKTMELIDLVEEHLPKPLEPLWWAITDEERDELLKKTAFIY